MNHHTDGVDVIVTKVTSIRWWQSLWGLKNLWNLKTMQRRRPKDALFKSRALINVNTKHLQSCKINHFPLGWHLLTRSSKIIAIYNQFHSLNCTYYVCGVCKVMLVNRKVNSITFLTPFQEYVFKDRWIVFFTFFLSCCEWHGHIRYFKFG